MCVSPAMSAGWGGGWCFGSRSGTSFRPKPADTQREGRQKTNRCDSLSASICFACSSPILKTFGEFKDGQRHRALHLKGRSQQVRPGGRNRFTFDLILLPSVWVGAFWLCSCGCCHLRALFCFAVSARHITADEHIVFPQSHVSGMRAKRMCAARFLQPELASSPTINAVWESFWLHLPYIVLSHRIKAAAAHPTGSAPQSSGGFSGVWSRLWGTFWN